MGDLMQFKYDKNVPFYTPAYHLYIDYTIKCKKFNQRQLVSFIVNTSRIKQKAQDFNAIIDYAFTRLNEFKNYQSICCILTRMYTQNYNNKDIAYQFAKKGFKLLQNKNKSYSYYSMRFFIAIQKIIGLQKFTDQEYRSFKYLTFKPLFLCFMLELLWKNKLKNRQMTQQITQQFIIHQKFIPFSDIHHLTYAKKQIRDPRFLDILQRLQAKMAKNINQTQEQSDNNIDESIIEQMKKNYFRDLYKKYQ